jgi:hypothetical protein
MPGLFNADPSDLKTSFQQKICGIRRDAGAPAAPCSSWLLPWHNYFWLDSDPLLFLKSISGMGMAPWVAIMLSTDTIEWMKNSNEFIKA